VIDGLEHFRFFPVHLSSISDPWTDYHGFLLDAIYGKA
jgi:hypothetical protein